MSAYVTIYYSNSIRLDIKVSVTGRGRIFFSVTKFRQVLDPIQLPAQGGLGAPSTRTTQPALEADHSQPEAVPLLLHATTKRNFL
jgi:hypothetical protein